MTNTQFDIALTIAAIVIQIAVTVGDLAAHGTITGISLMPTLCILVALVIVQAVQTYVEIMEDSDEIR